MDENKNELTDKISGYYEENLKEMRALHKQIQQMVFQENQNDSINSQILLQQKMISEEPQTIEFFKNLVTKKLEDIVCHSVINKQALGTFDKLQNEDMTLGEEAILIDEINDQDIEDMLKGVFDPFDDDE